MEKQKKRRRIQWFVCICSMFMLAFLFILPHLDEAQAYSKMKSNSCSLKSVTFKIGDKEYVCGGRLSSIPVDRDVDWKDFFKTLEITDYKVSVSDQCSHKEGHDSLTAELRWWEEEDVWSSIPLCIYEDDGDEGKHTYPEVEKELNDSSYRVYFNLDGEYDSYISVKFIKEYQITYDLNGGSFPDGLDVPYTHNSVGMTYLVSPVKSGSQFLGWTIKDKENLGYIYDYYWEETGEMPTFVANWENEAPINIENARIEMEYTCYEYEQEGVTPYIEICMGEEWLEEGRDYFVSYKNNDKAATADSDNPPTVTITGIGKYTGTVDKKFTIEKADPFYYDEEDWEEFMYVPIAKGKPLSSIDLASYIEKSKKITGTFTWENEDYVPNASVGASEVCTFTFTPDDTECYNSLTCHVNVVIFKGDIADCTVTFSSGQQSYPYTGNEIKPQVIVMDGDTRLEEGVDYFTKYSGYINKAESTDKYAPTVVIEAYVDDDCKYFGETEIKYTICKPQPFIKTAPTASDITYGKTLGDSILSGGVVQKSESDATPVEGTFTWKEVNTKPTVSDSGKTEYVVVFNPTDTDNYSIAETEITLSVNKAENAPNKPESTINTIYATVEAVALPDDWVWKDADKNKKLTVGTAVTATAVYNGADKGNYENETVSVSVIRSECDHTHTELRDAKEATCTAGGYTGDTYCTDCGTKTQTGTSTSALGHNYTGKVTTEPTTEKEGVMTYTCDRCHDSYTKSIDKLQDTGKPYLKGENGKEGWDVIKSEAKKKQDGDSIVVEMNGTAIVPGDVFTEIKGKDITLVFDMGSGIRWKVNGKSIAGDNIGDIDFSVQLDTKTIPVDIIDNVIGKRNSRQISLAYDGEFGFTAVLSIDMKADNAGLYANLFYYNEKSGELEFICADKIAADGTAELTFTHASDYVIAVDAESMDGNKNTDNTKPSTETETTTASETPTKSESGSDSGITSPSTGSDANPWPAVVICAFVLVAGMGVFFAKEKKNASEKQ